MVLAVHLNRPAARARGGGEVVGGRLAGRRAPVLSARILLQDLHNPPGERVGVPEAPPPPPFLDQADVLAKDAAQRLDLPVGPGTRPQLPPRFALAQQAPSFLPKAVQSSGEALGREVTRHEDGQLAARHRGRVAARGSPLHAPLLYPAIGRPPEVEPGSVSLVWSAPRVDRRRVDLVSVPLPSARRSSSSSSRAAKAWLGPPALLFSRGIDLGSFRSPKKKKTYATSDSHLVTDGSTKEAHTRLTSEF